MPEGARTETCLSSIVGGWVGVHAILYIREANVPSIHPHAPRPLATWEGAQAATMRCFTAWELTVMHHTR